MKKAFLLAIACVLGLGQNIIAQESVQEVTFVPDETQGYLLNKFKSNWFITVEGGAGIHFSKYDGQDKLLNRISPAGSLYVGKWFSPVMGVRVGANFLTMRAVSSSAEVTGAMPYEPIGTEYYHQKVNGVGPVVDVMLNLTNWWCGYKPNRVYNATFYAGAGSYWSFVRESETSDKWESAGSKFFNLRAGLINSFRVSNRVNLSLDLRATALEGMHENPTDNNKSLEVQAYFGITYNFGKTTWNVPVVPVFPEPENCDALRARLSAADARIADLEKQLKECLNRPVEKAVEKGPVATIYYPIGVSRLTREDRNILGAIANVMKSNPNQHYTLTGWADNYTGTEQINIRLRKNRVAGVEKELKKNGVPASQITATTNNGNLCDLGEKFVALDRAVTIEETK